MCVESLATALTDMFPHYLRRPGGREILVLVIAVVCFLLGLPFITEVSSIRIGAGGWGRLVENAARKQKKIR